jgi:hypothetical protein
MAEPSRPSDPTNPNAAQTPRTPPAPDSGEADAPARYDANLRLIRRRLTDEVRNKPKRRWRLW